MYSIVIRLLSPTNENIRFDNLRIWSDKPVEDETIRKDDEEDGEWKRRHDSNADFKCLSCYCLNGRNSCFNCKYALVTIWSFKWYMRIPTTFFFIHASEHGRCRAHFWRICLLFLAITLSMLLIGYERAEARCMRCGSYIAICKILLLLCLSWRSITGRNRSRFLVWYDSLAQKSSHGVS